MKPYNAKPLASHSFRPLAVSDHELRKYFGRPDRRGGGGLRSQPEELFTKRWSLGLDSNQS